jgi:hypothetical protein
MHRAGRRANAKVLAECPPAIESGSASALDRTSVGHILSFTADSRLIAANGQCLLAA